MLSTRPAAWVNERSTEWDANIGFTVNPANGEDFERCERKNDKTSSKEIDQAEHVLAALHSTSVK